MLQDLAAVQDAANKATFASTKTGRGRATRRTGDPGAHRAALAPWSRRALSVLAHAQQCAARGLPEVTHRRHARSRNVRGVFYGRKRDADGSGRRKFFGVDGGIAVQQKVNSASAARPPSSIRAGAMRMGGGGDPGELAPKRALAALTMRRYRTAPSATSPSFAQKRCAGDVLRGKDRTSIASARDGAARHRQGRRHAQHAAGGRRCAKQGSAEESSSTRGGDCTRSRERTTLRCRGSLGRRWAPRRVRLRHEQRHDDLRTHRSPPYPAVD